jgi:hypothetical protein
LALWRRVSGGASRASAKSSCGGSRGESAELLSRELGLPIFKLEHWRQKADAALDGALKEREADATSTELDAAMQRIGEPAWRSSGSRARIEKPGPLARRRSR